MVGSSPRTRAAVGALVADPQGLPDRPFPFQPVSGNFRWVWANTELGQPKVVVLIYDDLSSRSVSFWSEDAFAQMLTKAQEWLKGSGSLTVADLSDLQALKDAGPFTEPK